jgi:site-specific recombinase XerC
MSENNLSSNLKMKVRKYYEYMHIEQKTSNLQSQHYLKNLNSSLRDEVSVEMYFKVL